MNLMTWNPFREMDELLGRRMFGRFPAGTDGDVPLADWVPSVDISETDKEYVVKAELPGIKKEIGANHEGAEFAVLLLQDIERLRDEITQLRPRRRAVCIEAEPQEDE